MPTAVNIVMFSSTGLEHNFEKYTKGEVRTLPTNKKFYDFDVSKTEGNIGCILFLGR